MKKLPTAVILGTLFSIAACNSDRFVSPETGGTKTAMQDTVPVPPLPADTTEVHPMQIDYEYMNVLAEKGELWILEENIYLTGSDIQSFNIATREMVLADSSWAERLKKCLPNPRLKLFIYTEDDEPLLTADIYTSSAYRNHDLVFVIRGAVSAFFLLDGYPPDKWLGANEVNDIQKRKENAQKRQAEWDKFINYLSEAGKLIR